MATPYEAGSSKSDMIALGEAPAGMEMRLGEPLVGPAGHVFTDCLHAEKILRGGLYILNTWPFPVKKDEKRKTIYAPNGELLFTKRGFTETGLEHAQPTLDRIRKSRANVILAMGQSAMALCLGDARPVTKWRGSILQGSDAINYKKVVPTIHPAATLYGMYVWRYLIMYDMRKANKERAFPELRLPERELIIARKLEEVIDFIQECRKRCTLATDIEVKNDQVSCFSMSYDPSIAMTVPLIYRDTEFGYADYWSEEREARIWAVYAAIMADPGIDKINQNIIGFDVPFLFTRCGIITNGFLGDTMVAQHSMYPDFNKGLDFIASIHTNEPYWKDEGKIWENPDIDDETFWKYCGKDAAVALEAWLILAEEMHAKGYWETYNLTARLAKPLTFMTARGFKIDLDSLEQTKKDIDAALATKEAELRSVAAWDFNPGSPKQCAKYFYETKGIKPYVSQAGTVTTDDKTMSRIFRRYFLPEAKLVQEIRTLRKYKSSYLEVLFDKDNRLRCSWNPRGAWTGRLSSSQTINGTGMNLQNLHPEFKDFIVADPDPEGFSWE